MSGRGDDRIEIYSQAELDRLSMQKLPGLDKPIALPDESPSRPADMVQDFFQPEFMEEVDVESRTISRFPGPYSSLAAVLREAFEQASNGKGRERHAEDDEPFERQVICEVRRRVGGGYTLGQATKKIYESQRLDGERGVAELLGAINYIAAEIIVRREAK